eukprot:1256350-Pleurochrysis_carterae.AAC.2
MKKIWPSIELCREQALHRAAGWVRRKRGKIWSLVACVGRDVCTELTKMGTSELCSTAGFAAVHVLVPDIITMTEAKNTHCRRLAATIC